MSRRQGESRVARVRERCLHDAAGGGLTCRFEPVSHLDEAIAFHEGSQGLRSSGLGVKLYGEACPTTHSHNSRRYWGRTADD
jgi:hypothetical protein